MRELPYFRMASKKYLENGQALLVVLLVMSVIVTVVLSVVSRSVTEVAVSSYEEDALRAFSAAEAGIEQVLLSEGATGASGSFTGGASFEAIPTTPYGEDTFAYPGEISSGDSVSFWFVSHGPNGNLTCDSKPCLASNRMEFCWGKRGTPASQPYTPAIELSIYYDDSVGQQAVTNGNYSQVKVVKAAYDPNSSRIFYNKFKSASSCNFSSDYQFSTGSLKLPDSASPDFNITCAQTGGCLLLAKVRMFYNSVFQTVGINVNPTQNTDLPAQGSTISSKGTAGESTRKINVFQAYPEPPTMFEAAAFSLRDITH